MALENDRVLETLKGRKEELGGEDTSIDESDDQW